MTLQKQLRLMTAVTVAGLLLVIVFVVLNLGRLRHEFDAYQSRQIIDKSLIEIKATALSIARADPILLETKEKLAKTDSEILDLGKLILSLSGNEAAAKQVGHILKTWDDYARGFDGAIKIASESPADALQIPDALYKSHLEPMVAELDGMVALNKAEETQSRQQIASDMTRILWLVLVPLVLAGLVITVFQTLFNRSLKKRVADITQVVAHLHNGDLSRRLPAANNDEISHMAKTINSFVARFEGILRSVHHSADQTRQTARGISDMTTTVTSNAKEQSDKVFQVSAAVEAMGNTIREIAANVASAELAASDTLELVETGNETGHMTISALGRIDATVTSSAQTLNELNFAISQIGAVSNMIREIAEQTNLLALNAAIEAARAGDQGRGFAVVADEVRKLSERTSASTADITKIVKVIQVGTSQATESMTLAREEVNQGVRYGEKMGQVLQEIDRSVHVVTEMMRHIAAATEEQSAVGAEIASNIETVANISASTANDIERARNAMMELAGSSKKLHEDVGQFNLADSPASLKAA
ncbi:MAG TPA: methyl-accepting chemotaxis protein [Sulfuricella sp.]|nr:methyl-accepting chemotaxis protein [Sulfuricella sp.]